MSISEVCDEHKCVFARARACALFVVKRVTLAWYCNTGCTVRTVQYSTVQYSTVRVSSHSTSINLCAFRCSW
jgi:hypothetical protein